MKKYILIISISLICANLSFAQEAGKWRIGADIGMLRLNQSSNQPFGLGFLGAAELKYNLRDNMNVGLKAECMYYQNNKSDDGRLQSFTMTYDYYFTKSQFSPFIGAGLGYYFCKAQYFVNDVNYNNPTCFFRAGFEFRRFRASLTYNLIRTNETIFLNKNKDYISLTIGCYIGGGKRKVEQ
jgi:outer membrane protein W